MHKPRVTRAIAVPILLLVAACGGSDEQQGAESSASGVEPSQARAGNKIECATGGAAEFRRACTVEEVRGEGGLTLVLRASEGGFRRLLVTDDGRGVIAADGSEPAEVTPIGSDRIEVRVGRDRYRLPATVKGMAGP